MGNNIQIQRGILQLLYSCLQIKGMPLNKENNLGIQKIQYLNNDSLRSVATLINETNYKENPILF